MVDNASTYTYKDDKGRWHAVVGGIEITTSYDTEALAEAAIAKGVKLLNE
jgi:hypothetical protein